MDKHYTVSDGTLMLYLWPAEEGGYNVTSPMDPELITQAETIEEAFVMAYDAQECLAKPGETARELDAPLPSWRRVPRPAETTHNLGARDSLPKDSQDRSR